mmetsp:Transcript_3991/g.5814  ORF Transcript_3991/g.5814 Transcript_3991/m.5814 type:complete len:84 (+) Transcript_3991:74-325(+)
MSNLITESQMFQFFTTQSHNIWTSSIHRNNTYLFWLHDQDLGFDQVIGKSKDLSDCVVREWARISAILMKDKTKANESKLCVH